MCFVPTASPRWFLSHLLGFAALCWPFCGNAPTDIEVLKPGREGSLGFSPRVQVFSSCQACNRRIARPWSLVINTLTHRSLFPCSRSPDMLRSEVSFSVGGRHSSTDSNKASSGDLSPYDNNSPVLSERSLLAMQEDAAPGGSEKLYKGPEQYMLVGHLPSSKSRESSPGPRLGKGNWRAGGAGRSCASDCRWSGAGALDLLSIPSSSRVSLIQAALTEGLLKGSSGSGSLHSGRQAPARRAPHFPS